MFFSVFPRHCLFPVAMGEGHRRAADSLPSMPVIASVDAAGCPRVTEAAIPVASIAVHCQAGLGRAPPGGLPVPPPTPW